MKIKKALIINFFAGSWSKISILLFRVVQIPLLLYGLGTEDFGRWLILSSLPTWLTLANLGFGSVAISEISMSISINDIRKANEIFSTTVALVILVGVIGSILVFIISPFISWEIFVSLPIIRHEELVWAVIWLSISVFLSFLGDVYSARFRAARKTHLGLLISSFRPWIELLIMYFLLKYTKRFDFIALATLTSSVIIILVSNWFSWQAMQSMIFSIKHVSLNQFKNLFQKGIAFQAFPLGNALLFQGNLLVIQTFLGPAAVALFGTARTLVRSISQLMELINQAIWPELSLLLGAGNLPKAARLHRIAVGISFVFACSSIIFLSVFGKILYGWWTGKTIELSQQLLLLFLLPIPFNALWFTSSVVHVACNKHEGLAIRYLIATIISIIACIGLCYYYGIEGAAISTLVVDIVLIPYVLKHSLYLTNDNWRKFSSGLWQEIMFFSRAFMKLICLSKKNIDNI